MISNEIVINKRNHTLLGRVLFFKSCKKCHHGDILLRLNSQKKMKWEKDN